MKWCFNKIPLLLLMGVVWIGSILESHAGKKQEAAEIESEVDIIPHSAGITLTNPILTDDESNFLCGVVMSRIDSFSFPDFFNWSVVSKKIYRELENSPRYGELLEAYDLFFGKDGERKASARSSVNSLARDLKFHLLWAWVSTDYNHVLPLSKQGIVEDALFYPFQKFYTLEKSRTIATNVLTMDHNDPSTLAMAQLLSSVQAAKPDLIEKKAIKIIVDLSDNQPNNEIKYILLERLFPFAPAYELAYNVISRLCAQLSTYKSPNSDKSKSLLW